MEEEAEDVGAFARRAGSPVRIARFDLDKRVGMGRDEKGGKRSVGVELCCDGTEHDVVLDLFPVVNKIHASAQSKGLGGRGGQERSDESRVGKSFRSHFGSLKVLFGARPGHAVELKPGLLEGKRRVNVGELGSPHKVGRVDLGQRGGHVASAALSEQRSRNLDLVVPSSASRLRAEFRGVGGIEIHHRSLKGWG